ncbi:MULTISPECIES: hypothetical protein [Kitasatospora]|uniref:Uncharacterized protein n=1 Tax=Kitasatospora cystarginea TaxID=58350 RepID=A0ABN3E991_9ACTN
MREESGNAAASERFLTAFKARDEQALRVLVAEDIAWSSARR